MAKITRERVDVGQVWRDRDSPSGNRHVRVTEVSMNGAVPVVYYKPSLASGNILNERQYRSRKDRFQASFALVRAVDAVEPHVTDSDSGMPTPHEQ